MPEHAAGLARRRGVRRPRRREILAALLLLGIVLVSAPMLIRHHILSSTAASIYTLDAVPEHEVALVLGAKIWGDQPSHMLEDRLAAALALYESGRCKKLILSGAHHLDDYDEVGVMRRWLEARGVSPDDLYLDHAGLRTLDSMVRAKQVFGVDALIVVSQDFHVPRAIYLARSVGLDAVGVAAPARYDYPDALLRRNALRERVALARAWLDVHVLATKPKFGGEPIDLARSGRATH